MSIELPPLHVAADDAAKKAQSEFLWALGLNLASLTLAALFSSFNSSHPIVGAIQLSLLFCSVSFTIYLSVKQPQKVWYGSRAIAESVKTLSWRYMMSSEPFVGTSTQADQLFQQTLQKIFDGAKDIVSHAVVHVGSKSQITSSMRDVRVSDLSHRKAIYRADRIEEQLYWYQRKAKYNAGRSRLWFAILIGLTGIAICLSIARILSPTPEFSFVDLLVAGASSTMTWIQTKRFQEMAATYTLTSHEIMILHGAEIEHLTEAEFSMFVSDAENAFSREHTQWLARKDVP